MSLSWISVFLDAQAADFGAARNTQEAYGRDLKDFLAYLEARARICHRHARDGGRLSCALRCGRSCHRHQSSDGSPLSNSCTVSPSKRSCARTTPPFRSEVPARLNHLPKSLDHDEVDRLLLNRQGTCRKKRHDKLRLTCLMELLYATGMRVTELVSLPAEAVRGVSRR